MVNIRPRTEAAYVIFKLASISTSTQKHNLDSNYYHEHCTLVFDGQDITIEGVHIKVPCFEVRSVLSTYYKPLPNYSLGQGTT